MKKQRKALFVKLAEEQDFKAARIEEEMLQMKHKADDEKDKIVAEAK